VTIDMPVRHRLPPRRAPVPLGGPILCRVGR